MDLKDLDNRTRQLMNDEIDHDVARGALYFGKYLSDAGHRDWERLLRQAASVGTPSDLAMNLNVAGRLAATTQRRKPSGGFTTVAVPRNAADMLAEGEFNRFYIRALCLRAIADGVPHLVVYRAKRVESPRAESEAKLGTLIDPRRLLEDLRANPGVDTALGLPAGPNSGLSVHLPSRPTPPAAGFALGHRHLSCVTGV